MKWPNSKTGCTSTKHQEWDCLMKKMVDKRFTHEKWCKPCQIHYGKLDKK